MSIEAELLTAIYYQQRVISCFLAAMMDVELGMKTGCMDEALDGAKRYQELSRKAFAEALMKGSASDESDD